MLIRISHARSGIKEYLVNGQKSGREQTRDELDQRLELDGNLELTNSIIEAMSKKGDRYMHVTLAFKEDEISEETLLAITQEFRQFALAAYHTNEFNFYAEAHIPRIESYINKKTGEVVERKPHIHIVIPTGNLVSDTGLNPFRDTGAQVRFIDAFQEHINNKYGLASPKDNPRLHFTNASEMLSRYKGDFFKSQERDIRKSILAEVLDKNIESQEGFADLLAARGAVRVAHGKAGDYFTLKLDGAKDAIRLNDIVFKQDFIELPTDEKKKRLSVEVQRDYEVQGEARRDPEHIERTLTEWYDTKARELRYMNSGSKKLYAAYKAADMDGKRQILAEQEEKFHRNNLQEQHRGNEQNVKEHRAEPPPFARGRLRSLSELDVVHIGQGGQVLLQGHVPGELGHQGAESDNELRRPVDWPRGAGGTGELAGVVREQSNNQVEADADNVVNRLLRQALDERAQVKAEKQSEWDQIKNNLDGRRLLAYVSHTHGVMVDKYEVTKGTDGADKIRVGPTKHLSVNDFLTKKMGLTWPDAQQILRDCYAQQLEQEPPVARQDVKASLWAEFNAWRLSDFKAEKEAAWDAHKAVAAARYADIKQEFASQKAVIERKSDPRKYAERRAASSVLRMQRLEKEKSAGALAKAEKASLKERFAVKASDLYRTWLAERAEKGDSKALAELRRQERRAAAPGIAANNITGKQNIKPVDAQPIKQDRISYVVSDRGDVTYRRDGEDIIRDEARRVVILRHTKEDIETALRFSVQKFGTHLKLNGTDDFKRRAVEVAVESGLKIEFINPELEQYRKHLVTQKVTTTPTYKEQEQMKSPAPSTTSTSAAEKLKQWEQTEVANQARRQQEAEERARRQATPANQKKPKGPDFDLN